MAFSLQDYEIIEEIGHGGFGTILKARQKSLGRVVAIKLLSTQRTQKQDEIMRFRREAESMAVLSHDNIISVFDYAYYGNNYYIVMEYIDGITFDNALTTGMTIDMSLLIMEKVISGLRVAHSEKIIHRDIKPSNILLGKQGQVKLADFGLATFQPDITQQSSNDAVLGTFSYMAPEAMVTPKEVDERVDIFSLGCILYQILSNKAPFPGSSIGEVSYMIINQAPKPVTVDAGMQDLLTITTQSLNKNREDRPDLNEIHTVVREAIADNYHLASEELKGFISKGKKKADPTKISTMEFEKPSKNKISLPTLLIGSSSIALIIIVILIRQFTPFSSSKKTSLPTIVAFSDSSALSSLSNSSSNSRPKKLSDDSPKPVTSTSIGMVLGTLILNGILPGDSILINGRTITVMAEKGKQELLLEQGHYQVKAYRKDKVIIERKIRVMPYQKLIFDLEK